MLNSVDGGEECQRTIRLVGFQDDAATIIQEEAGDCALRGFVEENVGDGATKMCGAKGIELFGNGCGVSCAEDSFFDEGIVPLVDEVGDYVDVVHGVIYGILPVKLDHVVENLFLRQTWLRVL